jgi:hypothetical protein
MDIDLDMSGLHNGTNTDKDLREKEKLRIILITRGRSIYDLPGLQSLGMTDYCIMVTCK